MGWYKQACPKCWDNHDGQTCEEYQRQAAHNRNQYEMQRLMEEQNKLLREQNELLKRK